MRNFSKANIVGALALLSLVGAAPVHADTIFEQEVNDSAAQANRTIGTGNLLTAFGRSTDLLDSLDIDYYSFLVTAPGDVRIEGFGKSAGEGLTLDFVTIIVNGPNEEFITVDSGSNPVITLNGLDVGQYYAIVGSGLPQSPGSAGSYRIKIQGINGGIVSGTAAAPEPDTLALLGISLIPLASLLGQWRKRSS